MPNMSQVNLQKVQTQQLQNQPSYVISQPMTPHTLQSSPSNYNVPLVFGSLGDSMQVSGVNLMSRVLSNQSLNVNKFAINELSQGKAISSATIATPMSESLIQGPYLSLQPVATTHPDQQNMYRSTVQVGNLFGPQCDPLDLMVVPLQSSPVQTIQSPKSPVQRSKTTLTSKGALNNIINDKLSPTKAQLNEQTFAKKLARIGYHPVQQKLCSPEGGASLSKEGRPFFLEEMKRRKIVRMNKTAEQRIEQHFKTYHGLHKRCQPSVGNYLLERMNTNQILMDRFSKKHQLFQSPDDFLSEDKKYNRGALWRDKTIQQSPKQSTVTLQGNNVQSPTGQGRPIVQQFTNNDVTIYNIEQITDQLIDHTNRTINLDMNNES